jgi:hypothetical protein
MGKSSKLARYRREQELNLKLEAYWEKIKAGIIKPPAPKPIVNSIAPPAIPGNEEIEQLMLRKQEELEERVNKNYRKTIF